MPTLSIPYLPRVDEFIDVVEQYKGVIETQFNEFKIRTDLRSKPAQQLGSFLKLVGLANKTKYMDVIDGNKVSVMVLDHDRLQKLQYLESLEPERDIQWDSIHERYGFESIHTPLRITNWFFSNSLKKPIPLSEAVDGLLSVN